MPPYSQESSNMTAAPSSSPMRTSPPPNRPLQQREVATGVVNLGNTCYINAVLQALAHAPELCLAMDCEPHHLSCPVARANALKRRNSPSPEGPPHKMSTRKSRRSGGKRSPPVAGDSHSDDDSSAFCALCEVELHVAQVHAATTDAVAPSAFVHGFIDHVAPWFKLGVQEDSHEFLRLLIDAMQKSCARARHQDQSQEGTEYPFKLFRGTVESNVRCDSCQTCSSKIDPIEDIGLEVTSTTASGRSPPPSSALADVASAFQRFARAEPLDAAYKCDNCGKLGRATKQSRLASIPPILTLHLKRFRYGGTGKSPPAEPTRRTGRSEVSQLLGTNSDFMGKSGAAKIEGHIKFEQIFDLRPYLTEDLQKGSKNMYCRLFAVIVHAGKNSHSGHYVAYVRNVGKNEWWRMDDARVTRATSQEVLSAEAYMLFYRVVEHPIAVQLREASKAKDVAARCAPPPDTDALPNIDSNSAVEGTTAQGIIAPPEPELETSSVAEELPPSKPTSAPSESKKRKRGPSDFPNGEEWARSKTRLPPSLLSILRRAEEFISENVDFKPEFFSLIMDEANKGGKVGGGPAGVSADDVQGGTEGLRLGLIDVIYRLAKHTAKIGGEKNFFKSSSDPSSIVSTSTASKAISVVTGIDTRSNKDLIVPIVDATESFL